jgi:hypothetical protein
MRVIARHTIMLYYASLLRCLFNIQAKNYYQKKDIVFKSVIIKKILLDKILQYIYINPYFVLHKDYYATGYYYFLFFFIGHCMSTWNEAR